MFKRFMIAMVLVALLAGSAAAEKRLIVRTADTVNGSSLLKSVCSLLGCKILRTLDGTVGDLFLLSVPDLLAGLVTNSLLNTVGVVAVEPDMLFKLNGAEAGAIPDALKDGAPVDFYGATVRRGYVEQPATRLIDLADGRYAYKVDGAGVVAVIDTGVDPDHPVLKPVLVAGYDFTRNVNGGSEKGDVNQSTAAMVDQSTAAMVDGVKIYIVNQSTAAMVDQSTAAMVDDSNKAAFGHGTMVAGVIHLVAPRADIMPLKAFKADGSGYTSDILRAIYHATQNGANIINMSFSLGAKSPELQRACDHAMSKGLILVASAGNDGKKTVVYPAGFDSVMGVASTNNSDARSSFSNYGSTLVWIAAPGEGIVTLYPWGSYAAAWGTSFSTPFAAGAAALMLDIKTANETQAEKAISSAKWISSDLGNGRLDVFLAVQAWRQINGIK